MTRKRNCSGATIRIPISCVDLYIGVTLLQLAAERSMAVQQNVLT